MYFLCDEDLIPGKESDNLFPTNTPQCLQLRVERLGPHLQRVHHVVQLCDRRQHILRQHLCITPDTCSHMLRGGGKHDQQSPSLIETGGELLVQDHLRELLDDLRLIPLACSHVALGQLHLLRDVGDLHDVVGLHDLQEVLLHQLVAQEARVEAHHLVLEEVRRVGLSLPARSHRISPEEARAARAGRASGRRPPRAAESPYPDPSAPPPRGSGRCSGSRTPTRESTSRRTPCPTGSSSAPCT